MDNDQDLTKRMRAYPDPAGADSTSDVAALLLDVLRNVNRAVETTPELSTEAERAVANFRTIARDLKVRST